MSKGLETWKLVRKHIDYISSLWLKEQKHIENVEGHSLDIVEKELKALEIIKEKKVDVLALFWSKCPLKEYNNMHEDLGIIGQEEYDLLKEVLTNE